MLQERPRKSEDLSQQGAVEVVVKARARSSKKGVVDVVHRDAPLFCFSANSISRNLGVGTLKAEVSTYRCYITSSAVVPGTSFTLAVEQLKWMFDV